VLAVATGIAPSILWDEEPRDLATLADVLVEQGRMLDA
jgi:hypothetical protein